MRLQKLLYTVAATLTLTACSSTEENTNGELRTPINLAYSTLTVAETRAGAAIDLNDANITSGRTVMVKVTPNSGATGGSTGDFVYTAGDAGAMTAPDTPPYYPSAGTVKLTAWHPSDAAASFTIETDQSTDDAFNASDLMYSNNLTAVSRTANAVEMQFTHKLAKLVVNITAGTGVTTITGVKVKNVNPADSINVFFMYNNGYKEGTLAAQYTYVPVGMTDFTEQEGEWIYSMKIPDDVVNQHLAYFVYIVDKNGLKSWYGNGNETMHDAEFTLDCEPDFCSSLQLSLNPIRSDSCVLSFNLLKERQVSFKIFHTDGTPLKNGNRPLSTDRNCVAGENKYNMNDLFSNIFNMGINPREPLVISVSTGNHVAMAYFYVSRVKGKK